MQENNEPDNSFREIIETLIIRDVVLIRSEHKVHALHLEDQALHIELSHYNNNENKVNVKDKFIIFEMSLSVNLYDSQGEDKKILLESNADFAAIYSYENVEKFADIIEEFAVEFFRFAATTHIMAFARKYFYDIMINSGYPRLFIPLKSMLEDDASRAASEYLQSKDNEN